MSAKDDIIIERGVTFNQSVRYLTSVDTPFNLTGFSPRLRLVNESVAYDETLDDVFTITVLTGQIDIALPPATTDVLTEDRYFYALEIVEDADTNNVIRIVSGYAAVRD